MAIIELIIVVGANEIIANLATVEGMQKVWGPFDQR
jgi:hypothetical protein